MSKISYAGYRFPPVIIQQAVWLYARFTLSFRDVEDLLAERGIMVSYETVRRWVRDFGPTIATDLRRRRPKPHSTWHLDEVFIRIDGRLVYLWRAVDAEGEVLDVVVQSKRDKRAALKLLECIASVDAWAAKQEDRPGRSEAIRRLVELGLAVKSLPKQTSRARAAAMAGKELDDLVDASASADEQASRKRRLLSGPEEFQRVRIDRPAKKIGLKARKER